jgi:hypothetical protein
MVYHAVRICLTPHEKLELAHGRSIKITPHHLNAVTDQIHVTTGQRDKIHNTMKSGRSHKMKFSQTQIKHHDGLGVWDSIKSIGKTVLKKGAQLAIDKGLPALTQLGQNYLNKKLNPEEDAPQDGSGIGPRYHTGIVPSMPMNMGLNQLAVTGHAGNGLLDSLLPIVTHLLPLLSGGHLKHSKRGGSLHSHQGQGFLDGLLSVAGPFIKAGLPLLMGAGIHSHNHHALARAIQHHHATRHHRRGHHGKGVLGDMFPTLGLLGMGIKGKKKAKHGKGFLEDLGLGIGPARKNGSGLFM